MDRDRSTNSLRVEGFPRSGSTFLYGVLKNSFPDLEMPYFDHSTARLKLPNTIISIRHPLESIPSFFVYLKLDDMNLVSNYFCRYYKTILNNIDHLNIIDFNELTTNTFSIINKISIKLNLTPMPINLFKIETNAQPKYNKDLIIPNLNDCVLLYNQVKERLL